jgi:hypothetical protein
MSGAAETSGLRMQKSQIVTIRRIFAVASFLCAAVGAMSLPMVVMGAVVFHTDWVILAMAAGFILLMVCAPAVLGALLWSDWWRRKKSPDTEIFS